MSKKPKKPKLPSVTLTGPDYDAITRFLRDEELTQYVDLYEHTLPVAGQTESYAITLELPQELVPTANLWGAA